jgi:hypothetical protein
MLTIQKKDAKLCLKRIIVVKKFNVDFKIIGDLTKGNIKN